MDNALQAIRDAYKYIKQKYLLGNRLNSISPWGLNYRGLIMRLERRTRNQRN